MRHPKLTTDLYLYGVAVPTVRDCGSHATVDIEAEHFRASIVAWDPEALRRLASACEEAAGKLERRAREVAA